MYKEIATSQQKSDKVSPITWFIIYSLNIDNIQFAQAVIWFPSLNKSQLIKISLKEAGYNDILKLRKYLLETDDVAKAVDAAVISCIKSGILTEFLTKHRAEVLDVCITEFDDNIGATDSYKIVGHMEEHHYDDKWTDIWKIKTDRYDPEGVLRRNGNTSKYY